MTNPAALFDRYGTLEVEEIVRTLDPAFKWLSSTFFGATKQFDTAAIEHDIVEGGQRIAPFVSPIVSGKPTRRLGSRTYQIRPAYIKLADVVTPTESFTRLPGEGYLGTLTPEQRFDRIVAEKIATHDEMIENRIEWMAAQGLFNGSITITDDDYPMSFVDFERDPNNTMTAAASWGTAAATPMSDIQTLALQINKSSRGAITNTLVLTGLTYDKLSSNQAFRDQLNKFLNLSPSTQNAGFETGPRSASRHAQFKGRLAGQYDIWTYDGYFENDVGVSVPFVPANQVLFVANEGANSGLEGRRYHGPIMDAEAQMRPMAKFVKAWPNREPSGLNVVTQSSVVLGIRRPNATGVLNV